MNDPSKMYKILEALSMDNYPDSIGKKKGSNTGDKQIDSPSYQESKKCDDQCIDCFSIYCHK